MPSFDRSIDTMLLESTCEEVGQDLVSKLWFSAPGPNRTAPHDTTLHRTTLNSTALALNLVALNYSSRQNIVSIPFALHGERSENGEITVEKNVSKRCLNRVKTVKRKNRSCKNSA